TQILIPARAEVVPADAPLHLADGLGPTTRPIDTAKEYRVQPGDNLYIIAKKLYGKTDSVQKLYDLNRELIGPNPSVLKRNMVLRLPEAPTVQPLAGPVQ